VFLASWRESAFLPMRHSSKMELDPLEPVTGEIGVPAVEPAAAPPTREPRKAAIIFIFVTITLDILAMGMIARSCRAWSAASWATYRPRRPDIRHFRHRLGPHAIRVAISPGTRWQSPGAPFYLAAALIYASAVLALFATRERVEPHGQRD
jgi:hypothetical protein